MNYLKKSIAIACVSLAIPNLSFAQKGEEVTTHYYDLELADEIIEVVSSNSTLDNLKNNALNSVAGSGGAKTYNTVNDVKEYFNNPEESPGAYLYYNLSAEIWELTVKKFKEKLQIDIAPLEKLNGKINYNGIFPNQQVVKKTIKKAPGEKFYLSLDVDIIKNAIGVGGVGGVKVGGNVKPKTSISLKIANTKGSIVQKFSTSIKSKESIGKTKSGVGALESGNAADIDPVKKALLDGYEKALDALIADYLKDNKKAYR